MTPAHRSGEHAAADTQLVRFGVQLSLSSIPLILLSLALCALLLLSCPAPGDGLFRCEARCGRPSEPARDTGRCDRLCFRGVTAGTAAGWHFNLTEGTALSDWRPLLGKEGFWSASRSAGSADLSLFIRAELRAQLDAFRALVGLRSGVCRSAQHVHVISSVASALLSELPGRGIRFMRCPEGTHAPSLFLTLLPPCACVFAVCSAMTELTAPCLPPASPPHFLCGLPNVLIQYVSHFLACKDLLRFSRCSAHLDSLAHSSFSWKHAQPLRITFPSESGDQFAAVPQTPCPLSRFMPVHLRWLPLMGVISDAAVDTLLIFCDRVRILDLEFAADREPELHHSARIFSHPGMQALTSLRLQAASRGVLGLACSLPALQSLSILSWAESRADDSRMLNAVLPRAPPSLTELDATDFFYSKHGALFLDQCVLRKLTLRQFNLLNGRFRSFCQAPHMQRLSELTLDSFFGILAGSAARPGASEDDLAAGLSALRDLRVLNLADVSKPDLLLTHLHCCPALTKLAVHVGSEGDHCPSAVALVSVLLRCPRLSMLLQVPKACHSGGLGSEMRLWRLVRDLRKAHPNLASRLTRTIVLEEKEDPAPNNGLPQEWRPALSLEKVTREQWHL